MENEYLTSEEVLKMLRISKPTLGRWAREGTIPALRLGRQLRFPKPIFHTWGISIFRVGPNRVNARGVSGVKNLSARTRVSQRLASCL
jgi:excisionase family DNA binding protein